MPCLNYLVALLKGGVIKMMEPIKPKQAKQEWQEPKHEFMSDLVVVVNPGAGIRIDKDGNITTVEKSQFAQDTVKEIAQRLDKEKARLEALYGVPEDLFIENAKKLNKNFELHTFYRVKEMPDYERLGALADSLWSVKGVRGAYLRPPAELPMVPPPNGLEGVSRLLLASGMPSSTPDLSDRQWYLLPDDDGGAIYGGINAKSVWDNPAEYPECKGSGIKIVDVEGDWRFSHEDIMNSHSKIGTPYTHPDFTEHGTAVVGVLSGRQDNIFGIKGICPDAEVYGSGAYIIESGEYVFDLSPAGIMSAILALDPRLEGRPSGNIILIEMHRSLIKGAQKYTPVEWWLETLQIILLATSLNIVVVECAGNGAQNLDDGIFDLGEAEFGDLWYNPFNRHRINIDNPILDATSGAIIVGAGNPPEGVHDGRTAPGDPYRDYEDYYNRARCWFSNYGARVDVQGWGWEVTTTGYGDYYDGGIPEKYYTDSFIGTSSAAPIIAGVIASAQSELISRGMTPLNSYEARKLLRETGNPQLHGHNPDRPATERIGNRPDLQEFIDAAITLRTSP
jgi:hypothetical protein